MVLTTVKLKDLWSLVFVISLHKVQTQNLLFTFTWNVKRAQNNFVPIFNSKVRVRLIHECDYTQVNTVPVACMKCLQHVLKS